MKLTAISHALEAIQEDQPEEVGFDAYLHANYAWPQDRERILLRYRGLVDAWDRPGPDAELHLARAPGRINLIGEHTDYNGLPVFPMAINRDIIALFTPREDHTVILKNTDPSFDELRFELEQEIPPSETGDWDNYCKAAVQGLLDHFRDQSPSRERFHGFQAVFDGDLPPASGMSSSSALVVICALIFLKSNGLEMEKLSMADLLAKAERYVGTQGGGVDQATSLMGKNDCALTIHFNPLRVEPACMPDGYLIVAANSTVEAAKTALAMDRYNRRSIECRLAAAVLATRISERLKRRVSVQLLGDLNPETLGLEPSEIDGYIDRTLQQESYSLQDIADLLESSRKETEKRYCLRRDGSVFPEPEDGFKLRQRTLHVIPEGRRVSDSRQAFKNDDMIAFGRLMNRSHESCRDLYEISCTELDAMVEIALKHGALGSRLTGAGFGGCTVSLVEAERASALIEAMIQDYYRGILGLDRGDFSQLIFGCKAVDGAGVLF